MLGKDSIELQKRETITLLLGPNATVWTRKVSSCMVPDAAGHAPQELSCIAYSLTEKGGKIVASL